MREKRFQNKVATDSLTLPAVAMFTLLTWGIGALTGPLRLGNLLLTGLTAYGLTELNNAYSLIRIRSRLTSSFFLLAACSYPLLSAQPSNLFPALCAVGSYYLLFRSYQHSRPEKEVCMAFICTGTGSLIFPWLLFLAPTYYLAMLLQLRSFTLRSFLAGILGLLLPFWIEGALCYVTGQPDRLLPLLARLTCMPLPDYTLLSSHRIAILTLTLLLTITAVIHFFRTNYNDKIRTRMYFFMLAVQSGFITALLLWQPQHFDTWITLLTATVSPLVAHLFALTGTRATNFYFKAVLAAFTCLTLYNIIWNGSSPSW